MLSKLFRTSLLIISLVAAPIAQAQLDPPEKLQADQLQGQVERIVTRLLAAYHYKKTSLDDNLSRELLDRYLETLDFNRSYFLASDISRFEQYQYSLDNALLLGQLDAPYDIYNTFTQRFYERTQYALTLLDKHKFDFNKNEELEIERKDAPWLSSRADMDELWRKRIKNELLNLILSGKSPDDARKLLKQRYENAYKRIAQSRTDDIFQYFMNAFAQCFDPHTTYFSPQSSENFNIHMRLSLEGIGAMLRMEDDITTITELVPGGPADLSKTVKPGDRITAVGQGEDGELVDVIGWRLDDVVDLIRGPKGSIVRLQIVPGESDLNSSPEVVHITRDKVKLEEQAARSELETITIDGKQHNYGVITLPTFYRDFAAASEGDKDFRSTTRDVLALIQKLKQDNIEGLVIDLRENGGGSLTEATELSGLFIPQGPVVQVRNARGNVRLEEDTDASVAWDGPLVVLVDRYSASASEIFAAAMQDYGRAVIVGEPTYGKGTVQTLIDLGQFVPSSEKPLGQIKLTIAKFYRVNGSSTQHLGVMPDIAFPTPFDHEEIGESSQDNALPWDKIDPSEYHYMDKLAAELPTLEKHHDERMKADPGYQFLLKDIDFIRTMKNRKTISLNQKAREAERKQQEEFRINRKKYLGLLDNEAEDEDSSGKSADKDKEKARDLILEEGIQVLSDMNRISGDKPSLASTIQ